MVLQSENMQLLPSVSINIHGCQPTEVTGDLKSHEQRTFLKVDKNNQCTHTTELNYLHNDCLRNDAPTKLGQ